MPNVIIPGLRIASKFTHINKLYPLLVLLPLVAKTKQSNRVVLSALVCLQSCPYRIMIPHYNTREQGTS